MTDIGLLFAGSWEPITLDVATERQMLKSDPCHGEICSGLACSLASFTWNACEFPCSLCFFEPHPLQSLCLEKAIGLCGCTPTFCVLPVPPTVSSQ